MQTATTARHQLKQCGLKSAAELDSFSQSLLAPVAEFDACLAEELPIGAYRYISPVNGILPASWICGNKGSDIAAYQIRGVISETELFRCPHLNASIWN